MNLTTTLLATKAGGTQGIISMVVIYAAIIAIFWFFAIRPQKKQQKQQQELMDSIEKGDYVLTTSGFYGVIIDITDDDVIVEFGNNKNCRIPAQKSAISAVEKPDDAVEESK